MHVMEGYLTNKKLKKTDGSAAVPTPARMAPPVSKPTESHQKDNDALIDKPREVPEEIRHQGVGNATDSSENQSSNSSEKVQPKHSKRKAVKAAPIVSTSHTAQIDTEAQLESLLRGPVRSSRSVLAAIPSGSEGSDHEDGMESEDPDQEDEENDKSFRRLEKRLQRANSSSDEEPAAEEGESSASPKTPLPQVRYWYSIALPTLTTNVTRDLTSHPLQHQKRKLLKTLYVSSQEQPPQDTRRLHLPRPRILQVLKIPYMGIPRKRTKRNHHLRAQSLRHPLHCPLIPSNPKACQAPRETLLLGTSCAPVPILSRGRIPARVLRKTPMIQLNLQTTLSRKRLTLHTTRIR